MSGKKIALVVGPLSIMIFCLGSLIHGSDILLRDGTVVTGQIQQDKLRVKTRMGLTVLNVKDIDSYRDGIIKLKDGTLLKGSFTEKELIVETELEGFIILPVDQIKEIRFEGIPSLVEAEKGEPPEEKRLTKEVGETITIILTVAGEIQTSDPWATGARPVNEWAKPMYRVWFDANGNPNDGGWDNGWGPRQAELWLDTGRVGFIWHGPDGKPNTKDDVKHWPLKKIKENTWSDEGIEAFISRDGKSLKVSLPLEKLGNPRTLEVSFMASPWTTTSSDNLGPGANSRPAWIVVSDATKESTYSQVDREGDNDWPDLTPSRKANFDLIKAEVVIGAGLLVSMRPVKTLYEGTVYYQETAAGWWLRRDGKVDTRVEDFFPEITHRTRQVAQLLDDIGCPSTPTTNSTQIGKRIITVWRWLQKNELKPDEVNYHAAKTYYASLDRWPSLAEIANMFTSYGGIYWGTCMSRAQLFATLLYAVGLPPSRFAIAETRWKLEYSQHMYVIVNIGGNRWIYLDATCIAQDLSTMGSIGCTSADYAHPLRVILLPGSTLAGVPLVD
jgi:hypothetical protein